MFNMKINYFESKQEIYFTLQAHILPGLLLVSIPYVGTDPIFIVGIITASLGFNGSASLTNLANCQDLAPNFGTLFLLTFRYLTDISFDFVYFIFSF